MELNPLYILIVILLALSVFASIIVYHLLKYGLPVGRHKTLVIVFLAGFFCFAIAEIIAFVFIDWKDIFLFIQENLPNIQYPIRF